MTRQTIPSIFGNQSPFFRSVQDELAQMFDLSRRAEPNSGKDVGFFGQMASLPAMDIAETETAFEVSAEIPGVSEDDLDISVQGDVLVIKGEKSSETEDKQKDYHLVERRYGKFHRRIPLGFAPEDNAVSAVFENGVLKLTVQKPKATQGGVRKIKIGAT
jgi:HSP20 family protein